MANTLVSPYITRLIGGNKTDNPKIYAQPLSDGRISLYLMYYLGHETKKNPKTGEKTLKPIRQKKTLKLFLYDNPRTPEEREHNKETAEIAKKLRYEGEQEYNLRETGHRIPKKKDTEFMQYFREYIDNYTKADTRNLKVAYKRFVDFLNDSPKYSIYAKGIRPAQIDKDFVLSFVDYLQKHSSGEGAHTIYARFKKVVKYATEHDVFMKNPCEGISIKVDKNVIRKAILSLDEIKMLVNTPFQGNPNIRRAFLFSLYTGLRWCDVRELTFANVDFSNRLLSFTQIKTDGHSASASVQIPLNDNLLSLIGEKGEPYDKIFVLPTYEASCKSLKKWVKRAGIDKNISWHCARHSFAVNVLSNGADIKTVSSLLGHSSIAMTEKYLHAIDSLKRNAIDSLPSFTLS
ncbi:MAG: site-specific integrase [Prevotella sp.]|nr:site-specific integrase [Prevotella sp.]